MFPNIGSYIPNYMVSHSRILILNLIVFIESISAGIKTQQFTT